MCSWEYSGCSRGCCTLLGCVWSALRGPFIRGYIACAHMLAFTVVLGSYFPCIFLLHLAFRCPHMQLAEGSSQASKGFFLKPT